MPALRQLEQDGKREGERDSGRKEDGKIDRASTIDGKSRSSRAIADLMLYYLANGARERDQSAAGDRIQGEAAIERSSWIRLFLLFRCIRYLHDRERERGTGRARIDKPQPESAIASTVRS